MGSSHPRVRCIVASVLIVLVWAIWLPSLRSGNPAKSLQRGLDAFDRSDVSELTDAIEALEDAEGYEAHRALLRGMRQLRTGRPQEAVETFEAASRHPETRARAYTCTGEALYRMRRLPDACRVLHIALGYNPERTDAHRWLAAAYYDIGAMDLAMNHLDRIAELDADDPRPLRMRGMILKDYEKYRDAVTEYRAALGRNPRPNLAEAIHSELAECLIELREYDDALGHLDHCPQSADTLALRAEAVYTLGEGERAEQLAGEALDSAPDHREALILQATIALEGGETQTAIELLGRVRRKYPRDYVVHLKLAQAYRKAGKKQQADQHMREMERLRELRTRFSELHQQALKDTGNAELRFEIGRLAAKLGKLGLARSWFRNALALDPQHQRARAALSDLSHDQ